MDLVSRIGQKMSEGEPPFLDTEYGRGIVVAYCNLRIPQGRRVAISGV